MVEIESLGRVLGERLREIRENRHLNQEEVAGKVALSRASISNIEKGRQPVTLQTLFLFSKALDVSLRELVPSDEEILARTPKNEMTDAERNWINRIGGGDYGHP